MNGMGTAFVKLFLHLKSHASFFLRIKTFRILTFERRLLGKSRIITIDCLTIWKFPMRRLAILLLLPMKGLGHNLRLLPSRAMSFTFKLVGLQGCSFLVTASLEPE